MMEWSSTRNGSCKSIAPTSEIKYFKEHSQQKPLATIIDQAPTLEGWINLKEVLKNEGISTKVT